jgi:hypothetical protein
MWLVMRSIRSAGLVGNRAAPRWSCPAAMPARRWAKKSRTGSRRVHGHQHTVEDGKAHRAGVDGVDNACAPRPACRGLVDEESIAAGAGGQAAEHQQVVPRGVVEVAGQLLFSRSETCRSTSAPPAPAVQQFLQFRDAQLELASRAAHPQEAVRRQHVGQRGQFDEAAPT